MLKTIVKGIVAGTAFIALTNSGWAAFPEHTITMIVPFSAGGASDAVTRSHQPFFAKALGVDAVVKNTDGASGTLGAAEAAGARPDGYTLGWLPIGPVTIQPHLRKLPYDYDTFEPVCNVVLDPVLMLISKDSPWNTVDDIVTAAKANPNKYVYGSSGPATVPHLAMAAFSEAYGIKLKHLPNKGVAPSMKDMAGGIVQFFADPPMTLSRFEVKAPVLFASERLAALPNIPTFKELGKDQLQFSIWRGTFAPKGTPEDIVKKLSDACKTASEDPGFKALMEKADTNIQYMDYKEFKTFVAAEYKKNGLVLESAGLAK